jgi:hypothetical protein
MATTTDDQNSETVRIRTDIFFAIGLIYSIVAAAIIFLFWHRRTLVPINARSPTLLLISAVSELVLVAYAAIRQKFLTGIACPDAFWVLFVLFPLALFPYLFRCIRLYFHYYGQMKRQNQLAHKFASERFNTYVLFACMAAVMVALAIVQASAHTELSPDDQDRCQDFVGQSLYVVAGALLIFMALFVLAIYVLRRVNDEYSINMELKLVCLGTVLCLVPFFVLSVTNYQWPKSPYPPICFALLSVFSLVISVVWPLVQSFRVHQNDDSSGSQNHHHHMYSMPVEHEVKTTEEQQPIQQYLNPDGALSFSQFIQIDDDHRRVFETYLARTFQLPLLRFWADVRDYNHSFPFWSPSEQRAHADEIMETYIVEDARWELTSVDADVRKRAVRKLRMMMDTDSGVPTMSFGSYEPEPVLGSVSSSAVYARMFDDVEKQVLQLLEGEIWDAFFSSATMKQWKREQANETKRRR